LPTVGVQLWPSYLTYQLQLDTMDADLSMAASLR
jgi:hypothetical protein